MWTWPTVSQTGGFGLDCSWATRSQLQRCELSSRTCLCPAGLGGARKNCQKGPRHRMAFAQGHRASWCQSYRLEQGFSASALLTFWTRQFFVMRGCPVISRLFRSILGPHPSDVSSSLLPICDNQKCLYPLANVSWGIQLPPVMNYWTRMQVFRLLVNLPS